jgi:glycosyltransferase involved in cell wall biosynthesis
VCTSYSADAEPRAPRHARALADAGFDVVFVDCAPNEHIAAPVPGLDGIERLTHRVPTRKSSFARVVTARALNKSARAAFLTVRITTAAALSARVIGLRRLLRDVKADVYFAHNIDALVPAALAASECAAQLVFDCMEYYSDMGLSQSRTDKAIIRGVESRFLPACDLVTASSPEIEMAYAQEFGLTSTLALYNVGSRVEALPQKGAAKGLRLYWRNSVIDFGERGLDDALVALTLVPADVSLYLQGRLPLDGGAGLRRRIAELQIADRVHILPPYYPAEAVEQAAHFDVGLCLERPGNRNHELTVSNKIFDYMMAGLAVIASDLPGLATVMRRSTGGVTYTPGSPSRLADAINDLYLDSRALHGFADNARRFALNEAHAEAVMPRLVEKFHELTQGRALKRGSAL